MWSGHGCYQLVSGVILQYKILVSRKMEYCIYLFTKLCDNFDFFSSLTTGDEKNKISSEAIFNNPIDGSTPSCELLVSGGDRGAIPPGFCSLLPVLLSEVCECMEAPMTMTPSLAVTAAPAPTDPTSMPVGGPPSSPSSAPVVATSGALTRMNTHVYVFLVLVLGWVGTPMLVI
jgi:hypothetical protein